MPWTLCAIPNSHGLEATERDAWLGLTHTTGLGGQGLRRLLAALGSPQAIYAAPVVQLGMYVAEPVARRIAQGVDEVAISASRSWLALVGNQMVTLADSDYPPALLQTADPPAVLYLKGRRELLTRPALAIVGSRNATVQGMRDAEAFAHELADAGLTIVSGLALGIDASAHIGGLAGRASTVAVIGTGPDMVYPARNRTLARRIADDGAILSEFPPGTPSIASNFPRRNRIISGMSVGCLVIEATLNSGSLITARLAAEQGREMFALPGSIHSPLSRGCHALIRQGAKLVECTQDILEELGVSDTVLAPAPTRTAAAVTDDPLLLMMGQAPVSLHQLIQHSGLTAQTLSAMLLEKGLAGRIAALPGGLYQRIY